MKTTTSNGTRISRSVGPSGDPGRAFDFKTDILWKIFRVLSEFIEGFEFLSEFRRPVTIFGSAKTRHASPYYKASHMLAKRLGKAGFSIITGGGPGIMEAANRGAFEAKAQSVGLNIQLPFEQRINKFVKKGMGFFYFFTRKTMLSMSAQAYVFFPGGYGTMDEFFTICTLMQTKKIETRPLVLFGSTFWAPLDQFVREKMLKDKSISDADVKLYTITDSVDEAAKLILKSKEKQYTSI
ncbi:MAG: TIGR00730 family Rossman fold protein [Candidatus Kerfeldbacteria bacterium]|nr:TIGR00730 family Rossman fold protein [Candidatus Kerfeldbacteria bacterium]